MNSLQLKVTKQQTLETRTITNQLHIALFLNVLVHAMKITLLQHQLSGDLNASYSQATTQTGNHRDKQARERLNTIQRLRVGSDVASNWKIFISVSVFLSLCLSERLPGPGLSQPALSLQDLTV